MHSIDDYVADTVRTTDLEAIRERYQVGQMIEVGIPKSDTGKKMFIKVRIVVKYSYHCLCRMSSGILECFRWMDLVTVYSVRRLN